LILMTSTFFVDLDIKFPILMLCMLLLSCVSFSLLGFIIGIVSDNFEQINFVPMIIITPLVFLGGSFYTIDVLPDFWQTITLFNPIFYLVSGFRYSFFGTGEVNILISIFSISLFILLCIIIIWRIFKTGYKIKT
jgi:ABC-2 type transport system permease protein